MPSGASSIRRLLPLRGARAEAGRRMAHRQRRPDLPGLGRRGDGRTGAVRRPAPGRGAARGLAADPLRGQGAARGPPPAATGRSPAEQADQSRAPPRYRHPAARPAPGRDRARAPASWHRRRSAASAAPCRRPRWNERRLQQRDGLPPELRRGEAAQPGRQGRRGPGNVHAPISPCTGKRTVRVTRICDGCAWLCLLPALAAAQPVPNRIYALQGATARLKLPGRRAWEVRDEAGRAVAVAAGPDGALRLSPGGWYRLYLAGAPLRRALRRRACRPGDRPVPGIRPVRRHLATGRRASGRGGRPAGAGGFRRAESCLGRPGCPAEGTRWVTPGEALGARVLLAELARLRPGIPFALADAAWGGAGVADLLDPARPVRGTSVRVAQAAAPASALLVLAHGTTDAMRGTPAADYVAGVGALAALLRAARRQRGDAGACRRRSRRCGTRSGCSVRPAGGLGRACRAGRGGPSASASPGAARSTPPPRPMPR